MLPFLTALMVGAGQTVVSRTNLDVLAPIAAEVPARGGNTGGFLGLVRGTEVVIVGGALVLFRGWAGLQPIIQLVGVVTGALLVIAGWVVLARSKWLDYHDHPHVHPHVRHEHIHAHVGSDQTHDHARPRSITQGAFTRGNLVAVIPALAFDPTPGLLYLVAYLAASIVSMAVFGYWLGHSRRAGNDPRWISQSRSALAGGAIVLGLVWIVEYWPA